jgi:hypothetical protein
MNYQKHYDALIERARGRTLPTGTYVERHHVVPKVLGGSNDASNIVRLTPEEHYVAHQLLVRLYPQNHKLLTAAILMSRRCTGNKAYGWMRRRLGVLSSERLRGKPRHPNLRAAMLAAITGKPCSPETKAKISAAHRGRKRTAPISPETRARMSAVKKGIPKSPEARAKLSAFRRGKRLPPEVVKLNTIGRRKQSKLNEEIVRTIRARCAAGESTKLLALEYGITRDYLNEIRRHQCWRFDDSPPVQCFSPEECAERRAATVRGKPKSAEARAKLSASHTGKKRGPMPEWHRQKISEALRTRRIPKTQLSLEL